MYDPNQEASCWTSVDCPYCGESFETVVDLSAGDADYIEDCAVCCSPIELKLRVDTDGDWTLEAQRDSD